jgi:hypothetical protein
VDRAKKDIAKHQEAIDDLVRQWEEATALVFSYTDTLNCYACDQPLPAEKVQAARERAEKDFNLTKSGKLENIEHWGSERVALLEVAKGSHAKASLTKETAEKALAIVKQTRMAAEEKIRDLKVKQSQPSSDPKRHQLVDQKLGLEGEISGIKAGTVNPAKEKLQAELKDLDASVASTERAKAMADQRAKGLARVTELQGQQKQLGKLYEGLEYQRGLAEKFVVAKANLLTDRINSKFAFARFKLFNVQVNGGIEDTCEVMVDGVPYSDLNNGARINAGLDIINTLGAIYGISAPIFVDNAEAVVDLLPTRGQQIRLFVSASDPVMRVVQS